MEDRERNQQAPELNQIIKTEKFGDVELETVYRQVRRPSTDAANRFSFCPAFNPRTYVAEPGILCEQDVAVKMRDGITIYTDIYRPIGELNIPVIICWGPFGKRPGDAPSEWQLMGVPPGTVSRMSKFEAADPGYWCRQGYAVANADPRGVGHSEGDINLFGTQDGRDGYDFIEWIATQHWCNGRVTMFGNSGVAMVQWRIAAEQPPHLACIAPWEGTGDMYRESHYVGGIYGSFGEGIITSVVGNGYIDDMTAMAHKYPFINEYWEDKLAKWENIKIPTYITACWCHPGHLRASIESLRKIRSTKKWLRAHREFEWPDTYSNSSLEDLKRFYDRYLKDIRNGWELTPKVRLDIMDAYEYDFQTARPEKEFPIARTKYTKLYLDAAGKMSFTPVNKEAKISYEAVEGETYFDIKFEQDIEITGYMKLHLWVQADGHDDMDIFVNVRKLDENGEYLRISTMGTYCSGAWGQLRVSHRELDPKLSTDYQPVQAHRKEEKLKPGEIVPVDIEIWPHSRFWHKGQILRLIVAGQSTTRNPEFPIPFIYFPNNKGNHVIHCGGKYDSYLQIPEIPPKYEAGDYKYR